MSTIGGGDETQEFVYKSLLRLNLPIKRQSTRCSQSIVMYRVRYELTATLVPINQQPLTPQTFTNPAQMQQPLDSSWSHTTSWYEDYYGIPPFYTGPVHPGMAPNRQVQYPGPVYQGMAPNQQLQSPGPVYQELASNQRPHDQYRPPRSGPSRNRRRNGPRKAEYPYTNQDTHELSGAVPHDRSSGVDPGMARNDARNNPGGGEVWRTPSKNPLMADAT